MIWPSPVPSTDNSVQNHTPSSSAYCVPSTTSATGGQRQVGHRVCKESIVCFCFLCFPLPSWPPTPGRAGPLGLGGMPSHTRRGAEPPWQRELSVLSAGGGCRHQTCCALLAGRLRGKTTASQQQVLGDKLSEASHWALSPWALLRCRPAPRLPPCQLCNYTYSVPPVVPSAWTGL